MTAFMRETGIEGHHHRRKEPYFPVLAMLDTAELFDHIPKEGPWQLPEPYYYLDRALPASYRTKWDELLGEWIQYLDHASKGFQIGHQAATERVISGDLQSIKAAIYFTRSGLESKGYEGNITNIFSARRAFAALLSEDAQDKLQLKDRDKRATGKDIQNARTLVSHFERSIPFLSYPTPEDND